MSYQQTGGAELGECLATASRIQGGDFESWTRAWAQTADRVAAQASTAQDRGHTVSARYALLRASNYYRSAEFYATHEDPRQTHYWQRARACFQQGLSVLSAPIESIEIPFEEAKLPGYLVSGGPGQRPTLLAMGGFDSTGEEVVQWIGLAAVERGWHCLVFEGPGQRGVLHLNPGLHFRPDYEVPVRAVVDYALARPEVDGQRLALVGYSFGGYLAPRAAAFEPRLKACIANSLLVSPNDLFSLGSLSPEALIAALTDPSHAPVMVRWAYDHARWTFGLHQPNEVVALAKPYTLQGLEAQLRCPQLFLWGEDEIAEQTSVTGILQFIAALSCEKRLHIFQQEEGAASHCQMGGLSQGQAVTMDWLEEVFSPEHTPHQEGTTSNLSAEEFARLIEQYHDSEAARAVAQLHL
jgi:pimeloyl-ACP methyl ester carboxylesterase